MLKPGAFRHQTKIGIKRNLPERQDGSHATQEFQFAFQVGLTIAQFARSRFVGGRSAAQGSRNVTALQLEPVCSMPGIGLVGKSGLKQGPKQKIPRPVASKHPSGAIGAVRSGGQPQNQKFCRGVAKAGHGFSPIILVKIHPALFFGYLPAVMNEARAVLAGNDFLLEDFEGAIGSGQMSVIQSE